MTTVKILKAENGFIVRGGDGIPSVFAERNDYDGDFDPRALADALWNVAERLGCFGSDHDKERIEIQTYSPNGKDVEP